MTVVLWPLRLLWFVIWYAAQVVLSNVVVLADILTRHNRATPRIVKFESRADTDFEIAVLSIAISLTPGTLVVATRHDTNYTLFVHTLYDDREADIRALNRLEHRLLAALRPRGM